MNKTKPKGDGKSTQVKDYRRKSSSILKLAYLARGLHISINSNEPGILSLARRIIQLVELFKYNTIIP